MNHPPPEKVAQVKKLFSDLQLALYDKDLGETKNRRGFDAPLSESDSDRVLDCRYNLLSALYGAAIGDERRDYKIDVDRVLERAASILNPHDQAAGMTEAKAMLKDYVEKGPDFDLLGRENGINNHWIAREKTRTQTGPNQSFPNR